jgi:hypothetical protein
MSIMPEACNNKQSTQGCTAYSTTKVVENFRPLQVVIIGAGFSGIYTAFEFPNGYGILTSQYTKKLQVSEGRGSKIATLVVHAMFQVKLVNNPQRFITDYIGSPLVPIYVCLKPPLEPVLRPSS